MTGGSDDRLINLGDEEDADWAWAREWVSKWPAWSDEQWERISSGLGYESRERRMPDEPPAEAPEG